MDTEAVMAQFQVLMPGKTKENNEKCQDIQFLDGDFNPGPSKYGAVITTRPLGLVMWTQNLDTAHRKWLKSAQGRCPCTYTALTRY
jgi:hypothetical protein